MPPEIATDIYYLIVDNSIDVLMLRETWLYSNGDKAYIAAMTPAGYEFRSFPRTGSRGGGIVSCPFPSASFLAPNGQR